MTLGTTQNKTLLVAPGHQFHHSVTVVSSVLMLQIWLHTSLTPIQLTATGNVHSVRPYVRTREQCGNIFVISIFTFLSASVHLLIVHQDSRMVPMVMMYSLQSGSIWTRPMIYQHLLDVLLVTKDLLHQYHKRNI